MALGKLIELKTGREIEAVTYFLPEATAAHLAEQILIASRDLRDTDGLIVEPPYVPAAFEHAPRAGLEAISRLINSPLAVLDPTIKLKGSLAPINERPSAFRNSRKRHEK